MSLKSPLILLRERMDNRDLRDSHSTDNFQFNNNNWQRQENNFNRPELNNSSNNNTFIQAPSPYFRNGPLHPPTVIQANQRASSVSNNGVNFFALPPPNQINNLADRQYISSHYILNNSNNSTPNNRMLSPPILPRHDTVYYMDNQQQQSSNNFPNPLVKLENENSMPSGNQIVIPNIYDISSNLPYQNHHTNYRPIPYGDNTHKVNPNNPTRRNIQESIAKKIAEENRHKPLTEYIPIVKNAELSLLTLNPGILSRTEIQKFEQTREKERQVLAFLWIMRNCEAENDCYVARSTIFAYYASFCAKYNLKPLSQASLGKLIRSVFPHISTRRLGMRGQSKYHYCGLKLSIEKDSVKLRNFKDDSKLSEVMYSKEKSSFTSSNNLYHNLFEFGNIDNLNLPRLPKEKLANYRNIDPDIISALESLYHIYCMTIFENINFLRLDLLSLSLFISNTGSLSPQMFDLIISDELHEWIYECDKITHLSVIKALSRTVLQSFLSGDNKYDSADIIAKLETLVTSYQGMVEKATIDLPIPIINNKLNVIEKFIKMLKNFARTLKFIEQFSDKYRDRKEAMIQEWESTIDLNKDLDILFGNEEDSSRMELCKNTIDRNIRSILTSEKLSFGELVKDICEFISSHNDIAASQIMAFNVRFVDVIIGEISLKSSKNLLYWLHLNNIISYLFIHCYHFSKFAQPVQQLE
ncbi:hypothetical protein KAFR_0H03130 [Kazachstania africana CBS 2517]|uniref:RFX-type winged-helix domain-containing protein n=1 Tax=Kazachstania africana (strain ATCC 22294 / BCRC 22015 / CBS 2517 / CECT 1963 / NBRC 1671 / NRRL Y-8276) TaxID=1071382 RepID=H2AZG7_KAZAF|nr:hypothetical protein KAFR_0H03130 [Kazachstania africana CBS 2517]CCF59723.1 hypothetical protein KAFR_0H03130 [Kazachstania africana CBS 2517]